MWPFVVVNRDSFLNRTRLLVADLNAHTTTSVQTRKTALEVAASTFAKTEFAELTHFANRAIAVQFAVARPATQAIRSLAVPPNRLPVIDFRSIK